MFDIGWSEMLIIGVVLIVVVGPKDLPRVLRAFGQTTKKMRGMAGDFQRQFNQAMDEAELSELRKDVDELRSLNPKGQIQKHFNPLREAADDLKKTMDAAGKTAVPSEPVKGAVDSDLLDDPLIKAVEQNSAASSAEITAPVLSAPSPKIAETALTPDPSAPKPKAKKAPTSKAKTATKAVASKKPDATAAAKPRVAKKKPASQTDESQ